MREYYSTPHTRVSNLPTTSLPDSTSDAEWDSAQLLNRINMTLADLKAKVTATGSNFFDRKTMKFFGDTMRNYGLRAKPVTVQTYSGEAVVWEVYRRKPVKHGLGTSAFFHTDTYERVLSRPA